MQQFITRDVAEITVGLDLGKRMSHVFVVHRDGSILFDEKLPTSYSSFERFLGQWNEADVVFEVGSQALWVNALVEELGLTPMAVNVRELPEIYKTKKKSDRIDAYKLAKARWSQELPLVKLRSLEKHTDLTVVRTRGLFMNQRTQAINHVRAVCSSFGHSLPKCDSDYFHRHVGEKIPENLKPSLEPVVKTIESLTKTIKEYDAKIKLLCRNRYEETEALSTIPGVADLIALTYALTLHDCERFDSSRKAGAYVGLAPKQDQSSDYNPQLRISKAGDAYLRQLLVSAAHHILGARGPDCELRRFGHRICPEGSKNRGAKKRAVVAVARKLAVLMHHLWRTGESFKPFPNGDPREHYEGRMVTSTKSKS